MNEDNWAEREHGTIVRRYFHAAGASREMQLAQQNGWDVQEVKLNGEPVPENPPRKWWQRPPTRLVRDTNGTVQLRTGTAAGPGDWHPQGRKIASFALEVTYVRE